MFESTVVCGRIALGIQGEHHARKVSFAETAIWKERFGEGTFELLHQRNGDNAPYPVVMTIEDGVPYWYVTNADTAVAGVGKCELRYIVNHVVIKSCTFITDVYASLGDASEEAPEPQKAWVDQVLSAAQEVEDAVVHCPIIGENGNWFVWDAEKGDYIDTGVNCSGGTGGNVPTKLSQLENDMGYITAKDVPQVNVPTKLSQLTNDKGFVAAKDIKIMQTFVDYDNFYIGIVGGYADVTNWVDGIVVKVDNSAMPLLYAKRGSTQNPIPTTEQECIAILESKGNICGNGFVFRRYSEILGGDIGDIDTALDSIFALENALIGGGA